MKTFELLDGAFKSLGLQCRILKLSSAKIEVQVKLKLLRELEYSSELNNLMLSSVSFWIDAKFLNSLKSILSIN